MLVMFWNYCVDTRTKCCWEQQLFIMPTLQKVLMFYGGITQTAITGHESTINFWKLIQEGKTKKSFPATNTWEMCFFYGQIQSLEVICLCYVYANLSVD